MYVQNIILHPAPCTCSQGMKVSTSIESNPLGTVYEGRDFETWTTLPNYCLSIAKSLPLETIARSTFWCEEVERSNIADANTWLSQFGVELHQDNSCTHWTGVIQSAAEIAA